MATIKIVRKTLTPLLAGNDLNIIDKIIDYLLVKCDECGDKDFVNDMTYTDKVHNCLDCPDDKCHNVDYAVCNTCWIEQCCSSCEDIICGKCDDNRSECSKCDKILCEDCECEELLWCGGCEERFCCQPIYKIEDDEGDIIYRGLCCMKLVNIDY